MSFVSRLARRNALLTLGFSAVLSVLLSQLPLLNSLGYEFSLVMGALLPFVLGVYWLSDEDIIRKIQTTLLALALPPLVMLVNMLFVKNCTYLEGLLFYVLAPVIGAAFSIAIAIAIQSTATIRKKTWFGCVYLAVLILPVFLRVYFSPQIFFFNHIFGFFAGSLYDDAIEIDERYFIFRAETLCLVVLLLFWTYRRQIGHTSLRVLPALAAICVVGLELKSDDLGITSSYAHIRKTLVPIDSAGKWFMSASVSDAQKLFFKKRLELEIADLARVIGLKSVAPIQVFIYPDAETKKKFTGADNTEFAEPWTRTIHITESSFDRVIRHELVHILFGEFGDALFGASFSVGLLEGIAVALETPSFDWTCDEFSAAMFKLGFAPPSPESLLGGFGFFTTLSARSYTLMGSFVKYLLDAYGIEKFKALYGGASFESLYQKPSTELIAEWKSAIAQIPVPPDLESTVRFRFERKSIFQTECPHAVAVSLKRGAAALSLWKYDDAEALYRRALSMTEGKLASAALGYVNTQLLRAARHERPQSDTLFTEAFRQADSLIRRVEKPIALEFAVANALLWSRSEHADSAAALLQRIYEQHISFGYDVATVKRLSAIKAGVDRSIFSPVVSGEFKDSLIQIELSVLDSTSEKFKLCALLAAEKDIDSHRYSSAFARLKTLAPLSERELELHRQLLLLDAALQTERFREASAIAETAKRLSQLFSSKTAKVQLIDQILQLYNVASAR